MRQIGLCCAAIMLLAASVNAGAAADAGGAPLQSGLDLAYVDAAVRPQDDLYGYFNGKWLKSFEIPADKGTYDSFTFITDKIQEQLRSIVEALDHAPPASVSEAKKIADLYASFIDEARLEQLGAKPLREQFASIDALKSKDELPALIARLNRTDAAAPYDLGVEPDEKDSTRYAVSLGQSGLGLPDRDYYLKDDEKLKAIRDQYLEHIEQLFTMAGEANAKDSAAQILKLETAMAALQWTRVENRNPEKTYNKIALADLDKLTPGYAWKRYLAASGIAGKVDYVIVNQPSYFTGLAKLIGDTPLPVWKTYFKWHVLTAAAPYLSKQFVDARFAFSGTILSGIPQNQPRWKRGLRLVDGAMGEAIGHLYVDRYFPPENKARMEKLVATLLEAYRRDIETLEWMGPETKQGAQAKLAKLVTKIGYPSKWRDYGSLEIRRDDLLGNVLRADEFEYRRNLNKLGRPIDRSEWEMSPQTVNAYYNPVMNEIVFPAAILQPPFFDAAADDAVNYGGIVAVIGHEVSHGFDDQGSQFDADGNLHDWFTKEDHERFAAKTKALVAQYDAYEPVAGFHVNGELTLGENIADNSGLTLAYKAYQLSLAGTPAPVIGGFTGDQRFFLGWVQVWRGKVREAEEIRRIKTDPHSPDAVRGTAPLKNQPGFYGAFQVKTGDQMYLAPDQRVIIW
jgi:predicted metalloendopeptidase